jgi:hypothetical protein
MFFGPSKSSQIKELRESLDRAKDSLHERINNVRVTLREQTDWVIRLRDDYSALRTEFDELHDLLSPTINALKQEREQRILEMNREIADRLRDTAVRNREFADRLRDARIADEEQTQKRRQEFDRAREAVTQRAKYEYDERTTPTPRDWDTLASSFVSDDSSRSSSSCDSSSSSSYSSSCDSSSYSSSSDSGSCGCD